jgi:hypothetical protein
LASDQKIAVVRHRTVDQDTMTDDAAMGPDPVYGAVRFPDSPLAPYLLENCRSESVLRVEGGFRSAAEVVRTPRVT